mmetsp:Transcript_41031/g.118812  ORF Transcript_41031/g.118812 Transcript_41031/m.118812 type:complete len:250 (+) Transcript_41031:277-1026(+)
MMCARAAPATQARIVKGKPFKKKSRTRKGRIKSWDIASTTTLGGVAVGSKKAKDVPIIAGSTKDMGLTTAICAAESKTGSIDAAVPIEEKICEHRATATMMIKSRASGVTMGMAWEIAEPRAMLRPDCTKPELIAKAPPMSSNNPKSKRLWKSGQVRSACPGRTVEGIRKRRTTGIVATVASFTSWSPYSVVTAGVITNGRITRRMTCSSWIKATATSSLEHGPMSVTIAAYSLSSACVSRARSSEARM